MLNHLADYALAHGIKFLRLETGYSSTDGHQSI